MIKEPEAPVTTPITTSSKQLEADFPLIFERAKPGRRAAHPPVREGADLADLLGADNLRQSPPKLPEVSELDLVRHYTQLAHRQMSIDANAYFLGSCTMKYNPKVNEEAAKLFADIHPYQDPDSVQGALELLYNLQSYLEQITGMDAITLQPAAGAHGELTGILMIRAYHDANGEGDTRTKVIVPDGAHGTNPATATMVGYKVVEVPTAASGEVDINALKDVLDESVAAIMLTNPNTLGIFETNILEISRLAHEVGAQLYYDGANTNAIVGRARPGDMGFDVVHLNLHKTFTTPHGGGGPGTGPVGVKAHLADFLPKPRIKQEVTTDGTRFDFDEDIPHSIGRMRSYYGNFGNLVRAYTYICALGCEGLKDVSGMAVLNANYLRIKLKEAGYNVPFDRINMHEFVAQPPDGLKTLDIAKAMLDYGVHPMTVYFPLVVKEAMMVEPTETESLETLDAYAEVLADVLKRAEHDPDFLHEAPFDTPVRRLDEVKAARQPVLRYASEPS
ncbi:MAG: aminomethyl-transferring glycine dehydrogenase subunit GcvPB [Deinococcota bacterium]